MRRPAIPVPQQAESEVIDLAYAVDLRHRRERQVHDNERELARSAAGEVDHIAEANTFLTVYHGLKRQPQGWRVSDLYCVSPVTYVLRRLSWDNEKLLLFNDNAVSLAVRVEVW